MKVVFFFHMKNVNNKSGNADGKKINHGFMVIFQAVVGITEAEE